MARDYLLGYAGVAFAMLLLLLCVQVVQCIFLPRIEFSFSHHPRNRPTDVKDDQSRIIGGKLTRIEEHPYQVSLRYNNQHVCGGAIIAHEWVVTAAHCVQRSSSRYFSIKAGISDLRSRGKIIRALEIFTHPSYNRRLSDYDVALIQLQESLDYSPRIQPILLAPEEGNYPPGSYAVVSGWGVTTSDGSLSNSLREVSVPIVSDTVCTDLYGAREITARMICAGYVDEGGKDSCQGDSGGPLVQDRELIGIVSWGFGCAERSHPGVYTRVSAVKSWIVKTSGV